MVAREIHSLIDQKVMFNTRKIVANQTSSDGIVFDSVGFESIEVFINTTAGVGDGDFTLVIKDGKTNNAGEHVVVPSDDLIGNTITVTGENALAKQGYIGKKRFISIDIVSTNVTLGSRVGSFLIANTLHHLPMS